MTPRFPKIEKLTRLIESRIQERKMLLKEGEQLDIDALEQELTSTVEKALIHDKQKKQPREMAFEELIDHTERLHSTAGRLRQLREKMNLVTQEAQKNQEAALTEYQDLYETCAKRFGINTATKGWQENVTKKLREAKVL